MTAVYILIEVAAIMVGVWLVMLADEHNNLKG